MNERIKQLRKLLNLTQQDFATKIGTARNNIAGYETGKRSPSEAVISLICRTFCVSETWLRTGEGEMFVKKEPQPLDELLSELLGGESVTDEDKVLVKNFLELPHDSRKMVIEFVQKCAVELSAPPPTSDFDVAAELADLKRQNQELAAKVEAIEEEDALLGLMDAYELLPSASAGNLSPRAKK